MALELYRKKRNFSATAEPKGGRARKHGNSFVIQKHDATRLHYDFRLEMDGVLKSWAVTRGPSLNPGEKRLAVHVEDHPLEYGGFEGTIPKGEYGGGTVVLWDRGTWTPIGDAQKGYAKGHLEFELKGEKLGGLWHLVRMHGKPGEKRENWLLIKGEDAFARPDDAGDILEERPESVKTGRDIADIAGETPGWSSKTGRIIKAKAKTTTEPKPAAKTAIAKAAPSPAKIKGAKQAAMPEFIEPALATLATHPPAGARWLHEIKFDGYRLQAHIADGGVKLLTRSGRDWTDRFGKAVIAALLELPLETAIIDGELVVETSTGASDFSALQADLSEGRSDRFSFYLFDLLYLDGDDLTAVPLVERKASLERMMPAHKSLLRYSGHFEESGDMVLRHACRLSLEGVISKVRDAPYRGGRGKTWIKSKCTARQEFVVAGFVPSTVAPRTIGSLLLGVYEGKTLHHVGRVGTGFTDALAKDLFKTLEPLSRASSPFGARLTAEEARGARYVRPELVAEVEFGAWTASGHLRHAAFRGLREDKAAEEIVHETPKAPDKAAAKPEAAPASKVKLTHPDRVYWSDAGVTKAGLADYYSGVWRRIAPFIVNRPLALVRCPEGTAGQCFFQKHVWRGASKAIQLAQDPKDKAAEPLITVMDLDGLIGLVQAGVLEIHPWGSTLDALELPDQMIFDLDPGEGVSWQEVIDAALDVRARLKALGMESFVKTSGGKGLHVVSPLKPKAAWPAVKAFTKGLAEEMASDDPERYVATIAKAKRRGKILIDYLRNQRGQTAVAPYSTRARAGASVSMPLAWDELSGDIGPAHFTVMNAPARLSHLDQDPWGEFRTHAKPLPAARRKGRA